MADVDDRGQLMLVGALTLAVMFVALAVLLNAAIYTGNVATRDAGPGTGEAIEYEGEATAMAQTTIDRLSEREDESYADLRENFTATVDGWSDAAGRHSAVSLANTDIEATSVEGGTLARQDESRELTGPGDEQGWEVAEDVNDSRVRLNVSQSSLYEADDPDDAESNALNLVYEDTAGQHPLRIYTPSGTNDVRVGIGPDWDPIGECTVDPGADGHVVVDVEDETVGGEPCEAIGALIDGLDDEYDLRIRNGHRATGTYAISVDKPIDEMDIADDADGSDPQVTAVLYSAELRVTYRSSNVYYQSEFTVVPGGSDD